jgi:hypothetical protein
MPQLVCGAQTKRYAVFGSRVKEDINALKIERDKYPSYMEQGQELIG